jgi:CubicO group peptidase (beta-lactamase class C family)
MLFEQGFISLNDPVAAYIPAFKDTQVYAGWSATGPKYVAQERPITLYQLLTHTAGLGYGLFADSPIEDIYREKVFVAYQRNQPLKSVVEVIAQVPLMHQPGTHWYYSIATDVLGHVIEVVAGMPLSDFLRAHIIQPLGMTDSDFYVPPDKVNRLAPLYASDALYDPYRLPAEQAPMIGDVTMPTLCPSGGSGLTSTLGDYLRFCDCLLHTTSYEGGQLLSRKTLAWMTANHIPETMLPLKLGATEMDAGFGLGFRVATTLGRARNLTTPGEYGWAGLAKTYFWIDPAEELIGLFMTQYLPVQDYPVQDAFRNLAYQAIID